MPAPGIASAGMRSRRAALHLGGHFMCWNIFPASPVSGIAGLVGPIFLLTSIPSQPRFCESLGVSTCQIEGIFTLQLGGKLRLIVKWDTCYSFWCTCDPTHPAHRLGPRIKWLASCSSRRKLRRRCWKCLWWSQRRSGQRFPAH